MKINPLFAFPILSFLTLSTFVSCKKSDPAAPLTIDTSSPLHGKGENAAILSGTGFASAGNDRVSINGVNATVTKATSTELVFTVPAKVGSGTITVTVNGQTMNGPAFIYDTVWAASTFAGGALGSADGTGTAAQFNNPLGLCIDGAGNLYVTEQKGNSIRKITSGGVVTTLAGGAQGSADGQGATASFYQPQGICVDPSGNLFVADGGNKSIRKVTSSGLVSTLYKSSPSFSLGLPQGICTDGAGNLFVTDQYLQALYKIDANGTLSTFVGDYNPADKDGTGIAAELAFPAGICVDAQKNMYVAELNKNIRKITPAAVVSTVASIINPYFLCTDAQGRFFVTDFGGRAVYEISTSGLVTTIAGGGPASSDGNGVAIAFSGVAGICMDASANLYVADGGNNRIVKIGWQ